MTAVSGLGEKPQQLGARLITTSGNEVLVTRRSGAVSEVNMREPSCEAVCHFHGIAARHRRV
jgi:hypothetical protein